MLFESWIQNLFRRRRTRSTRRSIETARRATESSSLVEPLESRLLLTIQFQFDYSLDTAGFFGPSERAALEFAGNDIAGRINDVLDEIIPQKFSPADTWTATFPHPETGVTQQQQDLIIGDSVLLVFVGSQNLAGSLGFGGPGGFSASGTQPWLDAVSTRGQLGAAGPANQQTDFGTWGGSISFDNSVDWHFGLDTSGLGFNQFDFASVAAHELFHVLGFGGAASWQNQIFGNFFTGPTSVIEYDVQGPVPLENQSHWQNGLLDGGVETALDPSLFNGVRKLPTNLDYAGLVDIGWEIAGLGSTPGPSINLPTDGAPTTLTLRDDGTAGNGFSEFIIDGGTPMLLATNFGDLSIVGGTDNEAITIESIDSVFGGNIFIDGGAGDDDISINHQTAPWFEVEGGTGSNELSIVGPLGQTISYGFLTPNSGGLIVDDVISPMTVRFNDFDSVIDSVAATDRDFAFPFGGDDDITLGDDGTGGNGLSQISSVASSSTITFADPTGTITLEPGTGNDTVTILALDGAAPGIFVPGEDGDDVLNAAAANVAVTLDGGTGNDVVTGGALGDLLRGDIGDDMINGGPGNDVLLGGANRDTLNGGSGDDRLQGNGGSGDRLTGGPGIDTLDGGAGTDIAIENGDQNFVFGAAIGGNVTDVAKNLEQANITGGPGANLIDMSAIPGLAIVNAAGGNDTIVGTAAGDILEGGEGADEISAGSGADNVDGGNGNDTINGGDGPDTIVGGGNNDSIEGGDGDDRLYGAGGRDTMNGGAGDDSVKGQGATGDYVGGGPGNDTLDGGAGNDRLVDSGDVDFILTNGTLSGLGNDLLTSLEEAELRGGPSANDINTTAYTGRVIIFGGDGDDTIRTGSGHDFIIAEGGNDSVFTGFGGDSVLGAAGRDTIHGEAGDDTLKGQGASNDSLFGGPGNDMILGGAGSDRGFGGTGNDTILGEAGNDVLQGEEHNDSVLGGTGNDQLFGNGGDDTLNGGAGNDSLDGNDGDDGLSGFTGLDFLLGNQGNDTLIGGDDNDSILGAAGNDTAIGLAGDDTVKGQGGLDLLAGGSGSGADPGDVVDGLMSEIDENFTFMLPDWVNAV